MVWTNYHLKFRLQSPMHIGYRKVGNLMQTRKYVPGKNLWAALTARLTRDFSDAKWNLGYKRVGECVAAQFRFGYLWPSIDETTPCYFWKKDERDYFDFDYLFLDSYASAALDYSAYSTEEGSLHETEFIAPVARTGKPVFLLGDLWAKDGKIDSAAWQKSMEYLQLGGERTYGWGRLALRSNWMDCSSGSGETSAGHLWGEERDEVVISLSENERITAHALAAFNEAHAVGSHYSKCCGNTAYHVNTDARGVTNDVVGPVEPIVGREWSSFAGQNVCFGGIYFMPGGKLNRCGKFAIDSFGRWESNG